MPVPSSTAPSQAAVDALKPYAKSWKVSGPGARKNTQIQIGQCASRYVFLLRSRSFLAPANSILTGVGKCSTGLRGCVVFVLFYARQECPGRFRDRPTMQTT